ncbi:MAG: hypothetical protein A3C06_04065 [Candidatus Taylorbacteria bacterium RIFCSPHIGHO2_02_FULL_46_13]|uniref:NodB homology domain-containing protein n=1 Tax=Candidatus Taylorbacteria bacterium RIFCSPHIGHO2_02_FULL_46_13 TaxID=1802312 RepID=A0A1G2MVD3_9BACT|nr:MAG: hypothetical protein A3C06_04065 [Candidatus Taylorbacteria bacterium RIFCSPHIGHO2_02_FULL_46_13]
MKKILLITSVMTYMNLGSTMETNAATLDGEVAIFSPSAEGVSPSLNQTTPEILKIIWPADEGNAFIIEQSPTPLGPWRSFSVEQAAQSPTRRSIVITDNQHYYRVFNTAKFGIGVNVSWKLEFPTLCSNIAQTFTAVWVWDDGTSNVVTDSAWDTPLIKTYTTAGTKIAHVSVCAPDQSVLTGLWAVVITNTPHPNLVQNGDLEMANGVPVGWLQGGYGANTASFSYPVEGPGVPGDKALGLSVANYTDGDAKWYFTDVSVTPGTRYAFSDSYKSSVPTDITVQITDTNRNFSYRGISFPEAASNWTKVSVEFTAPSDAASVTVFHSLVSNGTLAMDNVSLRKVTRTPLAEGLMSFDFDDGWSDAALFATSILEQAGYHGTFYIVTEPVRLQYDDTVTLSNVLYLKGKGHEIGAHTLTHPDLLTVTVTQTEEELNLSRHYLLTRGIAPVSAFAYPYGSYTESLERIVREAGYTLARSVWSGHNDKGQDLYALRCNDMRSDTSLASVKQLIDQAQAEKKWVILLFHHIDNTDSNIYTVTTSFFTSVINYVSSKGMKVVTASEGARLLSAP